MHLPPMAPMHLPPMAPVHLPPMAPMNLPPMAPVHLPPMAPMNLVERIPSTDQPGPDTTPRTCPERHQPCRRLRRPSLPAPQAVFFFRVSHHVYTFQKVCMFVLSLACRCCALRPRSPGAAAGRWRLQRWRRCEPEGWEAGGRGRGWARARAADAQQPAAGRPRPRGPGGGAAGGLVILRSQPSRPIFIPN